MPSNQFFRGENLGTKSATKTLAGKFGSEGLKDEFDKMKVSDSPVD
jgi:hypothetical protein